MKFLLPVLSVVGLLPHALGGEIDFTRDVRPILAENCFHCHGPDPKARKGDLRLDNEENVKMNRDGGYAVVKDGDSAASELMKRLTTHDEDDVMPPLDSNRTLTSENIATIKQWIDEGGNWGQHWAFTKVAKPETTQSDVSPIDELIGKVHQERNIQPTGVAHRETLIRRLALDLTGLPPTPEQVDSFLNDKTPDAWPNIIDRFLASPAYGERMAWEWLDAARYADTNGYQGDRERTMWPWRDWVVKAFNENLGYDQFTIWQLAGDLLPHATEEQILATGFNRNHMINGEGGRIAEENRVDYVMDMSETMGTIWLGLTFNCCRCHDHKFDPLTQKDYYSLSAFFNQTPVAGNGGDPQTRPILAVATDDQKKREAALQAQFTKAASDLSTLARALTPGQREWELKREGGTKWTPLKPMSATAENQKLAILGDQSVLSSGVTPDKDTYVFKTKNGQAIGRAIRLEALQDKSFTVGGKGLSRAASGNFVLTEFEVLANGKPVKFKSAMASFEQRSHNIARAYDGDPTSGWAVFEGKGVSRPHEAIFIPETPIDPGADLQFTLRHDSRNIHHVLGRFRISLTADGFPRLETGDAKFLAALKKEPGKRSKEEALLVGGTYRKSDPEYLKQKTVNDKAKKALDEFRKALPKVMVMEDMPEPRKTFILERGIYNQPKDEVEAAVPALFKSLPAGVKADRLALANWLVDKENPLTARVTVNRMWQMIFGVGLVKTVEDFGVQSEYPIQSELLDWLAADFMDSGWDVKHLLRTILASEAYQRSSEIASPEVYERDPENRLLARGPRHRLSSWMIRDQALASSGLLNTKMGGPSVQGYQPPGIWEEATFGKKKYDQVAGDDLYRRSLYIFWRRIVGPTMFFDSAKRQICEVKSTRTNTPMHALSTLNDVTFVESARKLAERVMKAEANEDARLKLAGRLVLSRNPAEKELAIWKRGLNRSRQAFSASPDDAVALLAMGDSKRDESLPAGEHAALTSVCLMLLNLDETLNRE